MCRIGNLYFLKISFSWGSTLLAFCFPLIPFRWASFFQSKRVPCEPEDSIVEFQAPRPSASGPSQWSGWFSYINGVPADSPLPHSSCFELSSTTVTRKIRQVWPTPSAGMQPEAEPLPQLSCEGHNWSISGLGLGCCLEHHTLCLSILTFPPSVSVF